MTSNAGFLSISVVTASRLCLYYNADSNLCLRVSLWCLIISNQD